MAVFLAAGCAGVDRSVPALIKALKNPKPEARADAAARLGALGEEALPAVPALIEALKDRHVSVFRAAGTALAALGESARPGLTSLARSGPSWLRCRVVETLGRLEPSPEAVPIFLEALEDHNSCVQSKAVVALARTGGPAVSPLVDMLKSPNPVHRRAAAEAWGDRELLGGAVQVLITCISYLPESQWRKRSKRPRRWKTTKPDGDKIDRLVMDALEGVIFAGDQQVARHSLQKIIGAQGEPARTVIAVGEAPAMEEVCSA